MCSVSYMMHACSNCGCVPESYTNAECMSAPFHASHGPSVPHRNVNRTSTWCIVYGAIGIAQLSLSRSVYGVGSFR